MKALPLIAWSNRGRREHIKTEYSPGDIYRNQAIQGAFPTNPLFHWRVVHPLFLNLQKTLLSCHYILKVADNDFVF